MAFQQLSGCALTGCDTAYVFMGNLHRNATFSLPMPFGRPNEITEVTLKHQHGTVCRPQRGAGDDLRKRYQRTSFDARLRCIATQ
jgi:hypothetical protein